jgi:DNA-binding transcriptional regulator LsrR (DeoR family)
LDLKRASLYPGPEVDRMREARAKGLVRIEVLDPGELDARRNPALRERWGLRDAVPVASDEPEEPLPASGPPPPGCCAARCGLGTCSASPGAWCSAGGGIRSTPRRCCPRRRRARLLREPSVAVTVRMFGEVTVALAGIGAVPLRIGVAGGADKLVAIPAALRSGLVNALVTDAPTAEALLQPER